MQYKFAKWLKYFSEDFQFFHFCWKFRKTNLKKIFLTEQWVEPKFPGFSRFIVTIENKLNLTHAVTLWRSDVFNAVLPHWSKNNVVLIRGRKFMLECCNVINNARCWSSLFILQDIFYFILSVFTSLFVHFVHYYCFCCLD